MTQGDSKWSDNESRAYAQLADVAVPSRREQLAALITQIPFKQNQEFRFVDLACGEGGLTRAILTLYPQATALALDGSPAMLDATSRRLSEFGNRAETATFDIANDGWLHFIDGVDLVVSSLVIHHVDSNGKRTLYREVFNRITERGTLLIVDVVAGRRPSVWSLHAELFDRITHEQSVSETGSTELFDIVQRDEWNLFRYPEESEMPDTIFDNLKWLDKAGFQDVDCLWLRAGYAVFGGHKTAWGRPSHGLPSDGPSYEGALLAISDALRN
jgi:tRNA (cmo5U34)-methyltransferase